MGCAVVGVAGAASPTSTARRRAGSTLETWVGRASEVAGNPGIVFGHDIVVRAVGEFGSDAEAAIAFIEVAGFVDVFPILDVLAIIRSSGAGWAGAFFELI